MDNIKKPGIKYLARVNALSNLMINSIQSNDPNGSYNILYKMRIIHGKILYIYHNMLNNKKKLFDISCLSSVISIINDKIYDAEIAFNQFLSDNDVDLNTLEIIKDDNQEIDESDDKSDSLPLFKGAKSLEQKIKDSLKSTTVQNNSNNKALLQDEFDDKLPSLILFYNPTCPACIKTKPHWVKLTDKMKEVFKQNEKLFNIFEIDVSKKENSNISDLFKIEYVPTIIMMESSTKPQANIEKVEGSVTYDKLKTFIKESYIKFSN